ncbi:GNAT family N-acetyltransferase [Roseomonas sp. SG15]|uniref:GNAT family N-acetyltransferase n=2 Tax=Roseomonas indoligenes TaxID=2820811 RepID=A0A940MV22_9PROT|nr:GNAT family N-acetyltransferase [Pararoseomonas indoligenes]MBP0492248.1 GNAT family N-acetyltransferase [Pararoseomonas indoligenes]
MRAGDLPEVRAIAAAVHPGHPESDAVFAERLALHPPGCLLLEAGETALGYAIAHPWHRRRPPALDTLLGALPEAPGVFYLHDLAILPAARGQGAGGGALRELEELTGGLPMALVAIGGTEGFWQVQGFAAVPDPALEAVLRRYDSGARYMERPVSRSGDRRR